MKVNLLNMFLINPLLLLYVLHFSAAMVVRLNARDDKDNKVPYYTFEEHWVSPALAGYFTPGGFTTNLSEVGPIRLASMDANNIRIQIISHAPVAQAMFLPNLTALANDNLAAA